MSNSCHETNRRTQVLAYRSAVQPVVVRNYCAYASGFLDYLAQRSIPVADVIDTHVEQYLRHAIAIWQRYASVLA